MNRALTASMPLLQRAAAVLFPATGAHRRLPGQLVPQQFVDCHTCGVATAATVHGRLVLCAEGHEQPGGAA